MSAPRPRYGRFQLCERCGAPLTAQTSKRRGYGPLCWRRTQDEGGTPESDR